VLLTNFGCCHELPPKRPAFPVEASARSRYDKPFAPGATHMKYGYLEFRYNHRKDSGARDGKPSDLTINIGDNIQSMAIRRLLGRLGVHDDEIIGVNRDDLPNYKGEPVKLIMNGCFNRHCFPLAPAIEPVFFGFNTSSEPMIRSHRSWLERYQPIGCRDEATRHLLESNGIKAYVSGCLTMTFEKRPAPPENGRVVIAYGRGAGELPAELLTMIPGNLLRDASLVYQREPVNAMPLGEPEIQRADALARDYLDFYASSARLVITPLLHVASPCLGMGIPVILARKDRNARFTAINRLVPLHTPGSFQAINWSPQVVDVEPLKQAKSRMLAALLQGKPADPVDIGILDGFYSRQPLESGLSAALPEEKIRSSIRRWIPWSR
jgi:hypothetical protein